MRDSVELTLRGVPQSSALERYIDQQAQALERQCDRILTCHVAAEAVHRPQQQGTQFAVRLSITLPGTEVVVNREHGGDIYIALRDAFEAAGLQLKDHMRRQGNARRRARSHGGTPDPGG